MDRSPKLSIYSTWSRECLEWDRTDTDTVSERFRASVSLNPPGIFPRCSKNQKRPPFSNSTSRYDWPGAWICRLGPVCSGRTPKNTTLYKSLGFPWYKKSVKTLWDNQLFVTYYPVGVAPNWPSWNNFVSLVTWVTFFVPKVNWFTRAVNKSSDLNES